MSIMKGLDEVSSRALLILGPDKLGSILPALKADWFFKIRSSGSKVFEGQFSKTASPSAFIEILRIPFVKSTRWIRLKAALRLRASNWQM